MTEQEILQLIGKLVVWVLSGMSGAFILARLWGQKWIETKFQKDLEAFKAQNLHDLSLLLTRKVKWHEKEQEVLSTSWIKLINAYNALKFAISPFCRAPDLNRMSEDELNLFLSETNLSESEKREISGQQNKTDSFIKVHEVRALKDARAAFSDFHAYFDENRIFLNPDVKKKFSAVDSYILNAWVAREMSFSPHTGIESTINADNTVSENVKPLIDEIETLLQEKLFPKPNNH